jgi:hypothetical protein
MKMATMSALPCVFGCLLKPFLLLHYFLWLEMCTPIRFEDYFVVQKSVILARRCNWLEEVNM